MKWESLSVRVAVAVTVTAAVTEGELGSARKMLEKYKYKHKPIMIVSVFETIFEVCITK